MYGDSSIIKKSISVEIPEKLASLLDELANWSARKKNILIAASLNELIEADEENQESIIKKYLNTYHN